MFFIISKLTTYLLSPLIWSIALFIIYFFKKKRIFVISGMIVLLVFGNSFLFKLVINQWETPLKEIPLINDTTLSVVLLGGYSSYNEETNRIRFFQSSDRLMQSLLTIQKNNLKTLVLSGGTSNLIEKERPEASIIKEFLYDIKLDNFQILADSISRNTHESAVETNKLYHLFQLKKEIYLVTSAWHMRRAAACFEKEGFIVHPVFSDPLRSIEKYSFNDYIIPNASTLGSWSLLIKEWIGLIVYKIKGYI